MTYWNSIIEKENLESKGWTIDSNHLIGTTPTSRPQNRIPSGPKSRVEVKIDTLKLGQ